MRSVTSVNLKLSINPRKWKLSSVSLPAETNFVHKNNFYESFHTKYRVNETLKNSAQQPESLKNGAEHFRVIRILRVDFLAEALESKYFNRTQAELSIWYFELYSKPDNWCEEVAKLKRAHQVPSAIQAPFKSQICSSKIGITSFKVLCCFNQSRNSTFI